MRKCLGVVDIEFIMAVIIFLGSVVFVTLSIGREFFSVRESSISDTSFLRSATLLHLIMFDKGFPENWETGPIADVRRLGLSSDNNLILSKAKIDKLQAFCSGSYEKVKDLIDVEGDLILTIKSLDGQAFLDCKPPVETLLRPKFPAEGYGVIVEDTEKIIVKVALVMVL